MAPARPRPHVHTLDKPTPHALRFASASHYPTHRPPPKTRTELDVLIQRNQFLRESDEVDLSWEDQLAVKYYNSLFRDYCVVNLKHFRSGRVGSLYLLNILEVARLTANSEQIALRWRSELEVLSSIGVLTCGSLRCTYHQPSLVNPSPSRSSRHAPEQDEEELPLVPTRLTSYQVPFQYVELGTQKEALVQVVLCRECGKKLSGSRRQERDEAGEDGQGRVGTGQREERRSASPLASSSRR